MLFNIIFKQYLNIFIRNFVLCIQIRFVSTEKTTRIASRASCSLCLSHGYLPPAMIKTTIVPIVKTKCGNISESNNYRPIALATIISKLFESVLLLKCEDYLSTCSNQFGFKKGHSTDLCIKRIY